MEHPTAAAMPDSDSHETVLLSTFTVNNRRSRVYLHRWKLIWESLRLPHSQQHVELRDVIAVRTGDGVNSVQLILDYAKRLPNNIWRHRRVTMIHSDPRQVTLWHRTVKNYLDTFTHRPKRLLLFVNPYGGKKKALKIFEQHGKPLFFIANIDVSVIISQRANQIKDLLIHLNLNMYDAVACVGGDGTFSEVFNGLLSKVCTEKNINLDGHDVEVPTPAMPVGVIPGGSTDTVAYSIHGTSDIQTAVLHIIFGETVGLDLASTFSQQKFLRFYASVMSYGFLGDIAKDSERFRWMGPHRYDYSGLKKLVSNDGYDGEIRLLCERSVVGEDKLKCGEKCDRCSAKLIEAENRSGDCSERTEWKTVKGKFFMVNGANVSCACAKSPKGIAPYCHVGDGYATLVVVRHTSTINVARLLIRLASKVKTINDLPFVEVYRVREFEFVTSNSAQDHRDMAISSTSTTSVWNCDGEVVQEPDIYVRVHCQLLKVYGRGSREDEPRPSCFCCF